MSNAVKRSHFFKIASCSLIACIAILAGCSAIKIGYNNSATLAHIYLTSKIDLDSDQSVLLKTSLQEILQWHRTAELLYLAEELKNAQNVLLVHNGTVERVSADQVQTFNMAMRASFRRTASYAAPIIAKNMLKLRPNQIQSIQDALNKANNDFREKRLDQSVEFQKKKSVERMQERFERGFGSLNPVQEAFISKWAENDIKQAEEHYKTRLERQVQFVTLAKLAANQQINAISLSRELNNLLNAWQTPNTEREKIELAQREKAAMDLLLDIINSATAEQRNKAAEQAATWARDLQTLASKS